MTGHATCDGTCGGVMEAVVYRNTSASKHSIITKHLLAALPCRYDHPLHRVRGGDGHHHDELAGRSRRRRHQGGPGQCSAKETVCAG